eukprot:1235452-Pyramimonas_sp.AAC.1
MDPIDPECLSTELAQYFHRAEVLRRAAMKAWTSMDSRTRRLPVLRARHRIPPTFSAGELVFAWREGRACSGKWSGLVVVVLTIAAGAWINMRGALWHVSNEQMCVASQDAIRGIENVSRYLRDLNIDLERAHGARRYVDATREGNPIFPADEPLRDPEAAEADDIPDDSDTDADR